MKKMLIAIGLLTSLVLAPLVSVPASAQISSGITAASTEERVACAAASTVLRSVLYWSSTQ